MTVEALCATKEVVVCCGPGGVGKTTTAASIATLAATELGGRILVLTVDPAHRLATALGLGSLGNEAVPIDLSGLGRDVRGELWAAMLDTKASWDDLVARHAPDTETRDRILANPLYENVAGRFVQSHDYIAMERLHELHSSGDWDLVVVDTPPTRNALDFLDAPQRMADFFSSRLLRWLTAPYRSRLMNLASRPFHRVADTILGGPFLADIAEFFLLFQSMYDGFIERARAVQRTIASDRTAFVVVSTLEPGPARESEFFIDELGRRHLELGAVVLNKALPEAAVDDGGAAAAHVLTSDPARIAASLPAAAGKREAVTRVVAAVGGNYLDYRVVAQRQAEQRDRLTVDGVATAVVGHLDRDVADLEGLVEMGELLWR